VRLIVLCPHFDPDTAPTGRVMTRIVEELARLGHEIHVVTALPWYRRHAVEPGWTGRWSRRVTTPWGTVTRIHPFPGGDKRDLVRRALGFAGFSVLAAIAGVAAGRIGRRVDAVVAMSPPLTLGLTGRVVALTHRAPTVFNVQDVFPDAAVRTGAISDRRIVAIAEWLEQVTYRSVDAVTVLSDDLAANVRAKVPPARAGTIHVIPNFVDVDAITPADRATAYRTEHDLGTGPVVMYAGNVGFSQSLELLIAAARRRPDVMFVVNGEGAARPSLEAAAAGLGNIRFVDYQPPDRLAEVLASADVHVVPLRTGLGDVSVPSKTYSILAAGRPIVAAIDADTEIPRLLDRSGAGLTVPPDDEDAFVQAISELVDDRGRAASMGRAGRAFVERAMSPAAVGAEYERLLAGLGRPTKRPGRR
jgi:colanic acid biosynthesis glycosyl transferase WcaI